MFVGAVLVGVFGVGALALLRVELGVLRLEGVGDVLEEDQAEDDVLVLGRVHVVAQRVGGLPRASPRSRALAPLLLLLGVAGRFGFRAIILPLAAIVAQRPSFRHAVVASQGPSNAR